MTEKTKKIDLTLEESGWLCHLMIREIKHYEDAAREQPEFVSSIMTPAVNAAIHVRMKALYGKIADANDELMGKKS